jgi:hypothetical protein
MPLQGFGLKRSNAMTPKLKSAYSIVVQTKTRGISMLMEA